MEKISAPKEIIIHTMKTIFILNVLHLKFVLVFLHDFSDVNNKLKWTYIPLTFVEVILHFIKGDVLMARFALLQHSVLQKKRQWYYSPIQIFYYTIFAFWSCFCCMFNRKPLKKQCARTTNYQWTSTYLFVLCTPCRAYTFKRTVLNLIEHQHTKLINLTTEDVLP